MNTLLFLLLPLMLNCATSQAADSATIITNPMDAACFYDQNNPHVGGNCFAQKQNWPIAEKEYTDSINKAQHQLNLARINLASARMAQGKSSDGWKAIDQEFGIADEKILPNNIDADTNASVLVYTHGFGIGDIFHFFETARILREKGYDVTVSIADWLKERFRNAADTYKLTLIGNKQEKPNTKYISHIVSLMGHLKVQPSQLQSNIPFCILPGDDKAWNAVNELVCPLLKNEHNHVALVYAGDIRQALLIGGKKLPVKESDHGRNISNDAFLPILEKNPHLHIIDMGASNNDVKLTISSDRIHALPDDSAFNMHIVAAALMSDNLHKIFALLSDNGPSNAFLKFITKKEALLNTKYINPNAQEQDMRGHYTGNGTYVSHEPHGAMYIQDLSGCPIFLCNTPADQSYMIEKAYDHFKESNSK